MNRKEVYNIWAPTNKLWVDWVRPVAFIDIGKTSDNQLINYEIPNILYINELRDDTAIIIDIDSINSIKEGIALSKIGYRPIPLFNGTNPSINSNSTTNNKIISDLLLWGAYKLKDIKIEDKTSPVFLLDSNRLNRYKLERGYFDNSWDIYHQDVPTPDYFLKHGINKIIVRGNKLNIDLSILLYKYQQKGITIYFTNGLEEEKIVKIKKSKECDLL